MSATATNDRTPSPGAGPLLPPGEQFWKRYSPHYEAPLAGAGSFVVHAVALGLLVLFAVYLVSFFKPARSLPIDPVRLGLPGGGAPGSGVEKGPGRSLDENLPRGDKDQAGDKGPDETERPPLNPVEVARVKQDFAPRDAREIIARKNSAHVAAMVRLENALRHKLRPRDGVPPGSGPAGPGAGPGKAKLTQREKRMLRWHMKFTANSGPEYVNQLHSLGAILAIPVKEPRGGEPDYRVVRDLRRRPAKLEKEDLSQIQRIYWIDDKPQSVVDVMMTLGIRFRPSRFVAFMPHELEQRLFEMERHHVEKVLRRTFDEDKIDETTFRVVPRGRGFEPVLEKVMMHP